MRLERWHDRALAVLGEIGLSVAHVLAAVVDELAVLRERLRDP